jgi:hypothetical protein
METRDVPFFVGGFLALAAGNAIGAVYMFRGNVPVVMVGVALMVGSYQLMHYGSHARGMVGGLSTNAAGQVSVRSSVNQLTTVLGLLVSVYLIARGFVIGSQAALGTVTLMDMVLCGGAIVAGYIVAHLSVHGEVL